MRTFPWFAAVLTAVVLFFLAPNSAHAAPWIASGAVVRGDFNGDKQLETVVSSPEDDGNKGAIWVVDPGAGTATKWTRSTSGMAGSGASANDYFRAALAVGKFNNDAYDDLIIGAPGADDAGPSDSGVIHVIYGSSTGLTTTGDQVFHQDTTGINGVAEASDQFGDALTVGDFNCDTYDDVVIGVPDEAIGSYAEAGAVHVLYGSSAGVSTVDDIYYQGTGGVNGAAEADDHFGAALVAGNFNGDSSGGVACDDLAIGAPDEDVGAATNAGLVYSLLGGTSGLSTTGDIALYQDLSGVEGTGETDDRFGLRLLAGDSDGDGYDDLAVSVPGDSCISGYGEAVHVFLGTSAGLAVSGDRIDCSTYLCNIDEGLALLGCHSASPPVYGRGGPETIAMFVGDDIVHADAGADTIRGATGDDVLFGADGNDLLNGGAGLDIQVGGAGNDTFVIDRDCEVIDGEVVDGGPGTDTIKSHRTRSELEGLGLTISSVEVITVIAAGEGNCEVAPFDEGGLVQPRVKLAWEDLPDSDSVHSFTSSTLALALANNSDDAVSVELTFFLTARGWTVQHTPSAIVLSAQSGDVYALDLEDFIPGGIDPQTLPSAILELPTSAVLRVRAAVSVASVSDLAAYAPTVYGHLEGGDTAVLYRDKALLQTYYGGDLLAWRAQLTPSNGTGWVVHARAVPIPEP